MYDIITKVKHREPLSEKEIRDFVFAYTRGDVPDYQASAFLMAVCLRGLSDPETAYLTEAIADSGERLDLSMFGNFTVDKHSSGGVGDKTTLIVAPIAASLGCKVAKMSGRGLGHTGGTVDKLESIPGYKTSLSAEEFISQVDRCGIAVIGQSEGLAPADKKLYALRDVTATVDSIPLITSSIMGKKLASGTKNIVLDVKFGSGAFMKTSEDAAVLAKSMVNIGKACGRRVSALITDMDTPLGLAVGNSLEVKEAISVLRGDGPQDLRYVCIATVAEMLSLAKGVGSDEALSMAENALTSGLAYAKFKEWIINQGGDESVIEDTSLLVKAKIKHEIYAKKSGYIFSTDAEKIGLASLALGAGRATKADIIDPYSGIVLNKKRGDRAELGDLIATLYTSDMARISDAEKLLYDAYRFSENYPENHPLISEIIR